MENVRTVESIVMEKLPCRRLSIARALALEKPNALMFYKEVADSKELTDKKQGKL